MRYMVVITQANLAEIDRPCDGLGFEIRLDTFEALPDLAAMRKRTKAPLLATYRSSTHFGEADPGDRPTIGWAWRRAALRAGFDGADLEMDEPFLEDRLREIRDLGGWSVLSHHEGTPGADLMAKLQEALSLHSDVIKIIGMGNHVADFDQQEKAYELAGKRKLVFFYMGGDFLASRLLSLHYGAPFTFALPPGGRQVAPGIPTLRECRDVFSMEAVEGYPALWFAVVGKPIGHSKSPAFHNPTLKALNKGSVFLPFPADSGELSSLLELFPQIIGLAVTKPLKEEAFAMAGDFLEEGVAELGAVNTLVKQGTGWVGGNTDFAAMKAILSEVSEDWVVRVIGYGGLGKAVVWAGLALGLEIQVCNRSQKRLAEVDSKVTVLPWSERHRPGANVVVQATSVGMAPEIDQTPLSHLPEGVELLVETIYNPGETKLMAMAKGQGIRTVDGMALFQKQAEIQNGYFRRTLKAFLDES